jgi:hypothetical protein
MTWRKAYYISQLLRMLARTFRISDKLEALKPDETTADFNEVRVRRDGQQLEIFNNRYKTRLKPGPNQVHFQRFHLIASFLPCLSP